jgi:hypothetical protein
MARPGADYDRVACSTFAADGAARGGVVCAQRRSADSRRGGLTRGRPLWRLAQVGLLWGLTTGGAEAKGAPRKKRLRVPSLVLTCRDGACCAASAAETHATRIARAGLQGSAYALRMARGSQAPRRCRAVRLTQRAGFCRRFVSAQLRCFAALLGAPALALTRRAAVLLGAYSGLNCELGRLKDDSTPAWVSLCVHAMLYRSS